jgi:ABC transporter DrrB family efflux protein
MTATTIASSPPAVQQRTPFMWAVTDSCTVAWRNLIAMTRQPQVLVFSTIQPIIFVLMFRYVFGGAIVISHVDQYVNYLMPGVFAQTVVFGSIQTGVGLAEDLHKGLIERFRSLPMARSAVLVGRTLADLVRNFFVVILMSVVGYIVDWRPQTSALAVACGIGLVLAFSYSLSWLFAIVGLLARDSETAQAASFPILAPLVFASSAFVPVATMPGWLQTFAEHQPVSVVVDAVRDLTVGGPTRGDVLAAIAWIVGIVAVCAPIAVRQYRRVV